MILRVCKSFSNILYIHFLENTAFAGFDGIDRFTDIISDIVHCISLCRKREYFTFNVGENNLLALLPFVVEEGILIERTCARLFHDYITSLVACS